MINKVLENLKIASLNEMQLASLEAAKKESDVVLLSPTGSGKTLGFLLPVLNSLDPKKSGVQVLIMAPSRELSLQIEQVFKAMSTGFKVNCCYGGHPFKVEKNNLEQPPAVLIGTPGRLADHFRRKSFTANSIHTLVLDEFDKALELGFQTDMAYIIRELPALKKRILTSATQAIKIPEFAGVVKPVTINFLENTAPKGLKLKAVVAEGSDKLEALLKLICTIGSKPTLIFCNHREAVERISEVLSTKGLAHDTFHGGLEQDDRERTLIKFRNGSYNYLITTDLASRGLDIPEIEFIIHYQLPVNESAFVHRNGRTARMNAEGTAYLILAEDEQLPDFIKEKPEVEKLPDEIKLPSNSDWETLYISAGRKDKINKIDIVGLLHRKGGLEKNELGLIEVLDRCSYAAVKRSKVNKLLQLVGKEKIKKQSVKIDVAR